MATIKVNAWAFCPGRRTVGRMTATTFAATNTTFTAVKIAGIKRFEQDCNFWAFCEACEMEERGNM